MRSSFSDGLRNGLANLFLPGLFLSRLLVTFQDAGHTFTIFRFLRDFFGFIHANSMTHLERQSEKLEVHTLRDHFVTVWGQDGDPQTTYLFERSQWRDW